MSQVMTQTRLAVGTNVGVRRGVADPNFPHLSIEGWSGTIVEIDENRAAACLVRWDGSTMEYADPVWRAPCERDGLVFEEMWLAEKDLSVDSNLDPEIFVN
jgi:hypothetical protein